MKTITLVKPYPIICHLSWAANPMVVDDGIEDAKQICKATVDWREGNKAQVTVTFHAHPGKAEVIKYEHIYDCGPCCWIKIGRKFYRLQLGWELDDCLPAECDRNGFYAPCHETNQVMLVDDSCKINAYLVAVRMLYDGVTDNRDLKPWNVAPDMPQRATH